MSATPLFRLLRERKLFQWAVAYLAAGWALVEATSLVVDQFHWPDVVGQVVTVVAFFGFFVVLVLAWYHGEKGYQRARSSELLIITGILVVAGAAVAGVRRNAASAAAVEPDGLSALARFAATGSDRPTIAVLPLANLSADPENAYFAAGIHEELLRHLSLVRALAVISRTSVLQYAGGAKAIREIAAEIGARYIVEGSVQEDRGQVRIQVQLIDATTDEHVWAERYDRTLANIFDLQSELAQAVATALEAVVTPEERTRIEARPTDDLQAYDLYLQALHLDRYVRVELDSAIVLLRRATTLDPAFALAHARLALIFRDGTVVHRAVPYDSAVTRANLAVELNPRLPEALAIKGYLLGEMEQDEAARVLLLESLTLDPSNALPWTALAFVGWTSGDNVGGASAAVQALRLDPKGWGPPMHLGYCLFGAGMTVEAALWFEQTLSLEPNQMWSLQALSVLSYINGDRNAVGDYIARMRQAAADNLFVLYYAAMAGYMLGDLGAAEEALAQLVATAPDYSNMYFPTAEALLGWVVAQSRPSKGRALLESVRRRQMEGAGADMPYAPDMVVIASVLGSEDEELRWFLEVARRGPSAFNGLMAPFFPWLDPIRDRPEFQAWMHDLQQGLASQQRELAAMGEWTPEAILANGGG